MRENMTNTPAHAIALARTDQGPFPVGMCLQKVRTCYGVPARYGDATTAWAQADHRHLETNPADIPRGVPVFWTGGSHGYGHIAISTGGGECWSTDIRRPGYWAKVPISEVHRRWGLTLVGWTEDLNGVRVWTPPAPPKPTRVDRARVLMDQALVLLRDAQTKAGRIGAVKEAADHLEQAVTRLPRH